jgi:cytochrome d ubiquinol oxidase subunit I
VFSRSAHLVLPLALAATVACGVFGDSQGRLLETQQPMKMAAAEALYNTTKGASFSIFAVGAFKTNPKHLDPDVRIPHLLSLIATLSWNGTVKGINQVNAAEQKQYGPGNYVPILGVTYWSFRLMVGAGTFMFLLTALGLALMRAGKLERSRWFGRAAVAGIFVPIIANWSGWIFTEMGRQPWVVYGLLKTSQSRSPDVSEGSIIISLVAYVLLYGVLIAVGTRLFVREIKHGPDDPPGPGGPDEGAGSNLSLAY